MAADCVGRHRLSDRCEGDQPVTTGPAGSAPAALDLAQTRTALRARRGPVDRTRRPCAVPGSDQAPITPGHRNAQSLAVSAGRQARTMVRVATTSQCDRLLRPSQAGKRGDLTRDGAVVMLALAVAVRDGTSFCRCSVFDSA
jgi:hypothetical protein